MNQYDLVIVGGGPAGLTAAIYAGRRKLKTLLIAKGLGGQVMLTHEIENYPGFDLISGFELAEKMKNQAKKWEVEFLSNEVEKIEPAKDGFAVMTNKDKYHAKAVILAFGLTPRDLGVPGEEELKGRGVSYCATCDGPFFKNKIVGVVGGGNAALESTEYLSKLAKKVYLIHFKETFSGEAHLLDKVKACPNVEILCCVEVKEIKGKNKVESIIFSQKDGQDLEIKMDGLFIEIGNEAKTDWLKDLVAVNKKGEVIIDHSNETSVKGIFAAGDCTDTHYKQIVISAGEGAKAALMAYRHVTAKTGGSKVPDWGKK